MVDLNSLLKQALAEKEAGDLAKAGRTKLKDTRLADRERQEIADKVREWESEADYKAVALVHRQTKYVCKTCAIPHYAGGQVFVQERHVRIANTQRWIAAKPPYREDLPRKADYIEVQIEICGVCAVAAGGFPEMLL